MIVNKTPAERYPIGVEFEGRTPFGSAIVSGVVTSFNDETGDADSSVIQSGSALIVGTQARLGVQAGVVGSQYMVHLVVTCDEGSVLEDKILVIVE